uniref:Uncharacterized protein MANES_09G105000 n=1 Tax=Rhizophora mucronata TaxID=61149 RepID=A0A2P2IHC8_RHIMU
MIPSQMMSRNTKSLLQEVLLKGSHQKMVKMGTPKGFVQFALMLQGIVSSSHVGTVLLVLPVE